MCLASYLVHTSQELTFLLNVTVLHRVNDTRLLGRERCAKTRSPFYLFLIQGVTWCILAMFIFPTMHLPHFLESFYFF